MPKLNIDLNALKHTTAQAIRQGEIEREIAERKRQEEEARKQLERELKAERIISQIPSRCQQEASAGRKWAAVMSFSSVDAEYDRPAHTQELWNICRPEWLGGAAHLVYEACVEAKLNPTLEFWHDGVGINSGFNIVVHW